MNLDFYRLEPTALSSWRLIVQMGYTSRTYKFALAAALYDFSARGYEAVALPDLASAYAMGLVRHLANAPQAPATSVRSETDFLRIVEAEAEASILLGQATERLTDAAVRTIPRMVMDKFHNLDGSEAAHRFYEIHGRGTARTVELTPHLRALATHEQKANLPSETNARWNIVEYGYHTGIGTSLLQQGLVVDLTDLILLDRVRRKPVTGVTEAVLPFQHGRCLLCDQPLLLGMEIAVDHTFPLVLMRRFQEANAWHGPDLDDLWNLAPAHRTCNSDKRDRKPEAEALHRLARRNEAIMESRKPLRWTLKRTLSNNGFPSKAGQWHRFLRQILNDYYAHP